MRIMQLVALLIVIFHLVLGEATCHGNDTNLAHALRTTKDGTLSRQRRHLVFPKGSAFVVTISTLKAIQIPEPSNWNIDFEFDMIWPIPVQENFKRLRSKKKKWMMKRRDRREVYANLQLALESQGFPGHECVLQAICEAGYLLSPIGVSFIEDLLHTILRNSDNVKEIDSYDMAYRATTMKTDCEAVYSCPFSPLKLLLATIDFAERKESPN